MASPGIMEVVRYYAVGLLNTAFGFGAYSVFLYFGFNMFVAQFLGAVLGTIFNFLTYKNLVFLKSRASTIRFAGAYVFNYALSASILYVVSRVIASPYVAGFVTLLVVTCINYFILKRLVFKSAEAPVSRR